MFKHPKKHGLTYCQHFCFAFCTAIKLVLVGFACLIHAFLPFLFTNTTSSFVKNLDRKFLEKGIGGRIWHSSRDRGFVDLFDKDQ